ncbi:MULTISPECIES: AAA family ATPase [unclassified Acidovorax]|uniref:AAA family ATPase n=1 Tax=unclassified Acidovorax TaxID=2684926 RepID=UPI0028832F5E|nr:MULTISPECIES: AAA family ATPase [unclassified Acidovorax]
MYAPFFGLQHAPFSIAPDPRYLFMSDRHREALAHLLYGLDAGGGFVLLTGEIGTGKTTVCRCFLEQIPAHCNVAYIFNPKLTVGELLRSICDEFGVAHVPAVPGAETVKDCLDPLNAFLLAQHAAGRNNVLIIDEAQNLAPDVLEQLRLLTNLETSERKLLQIILIGQPELRGMVASPSLEQLAQRVIARFHLDALTAQETTQYIEHRLRVAGLAGPLPFDRRALQRVHRLTRGVPRRINLLCDRALLGAYAAGTHHVTDTTVRRAAREVFGAAPAAATGDKARAAGAGSQRWRAGAVGALAGAAAVAAGVWAWQSTRSVPPPSQAVAQKAAPASAAAAPASAPAVDPLAPFLAAQPSGDGPAWQALATAWGAAALAENADACAALLSQADLRCWRTPRASLSLVRQLDRPVLLTLYPGADAAPVAAVLRTLQGDIATLEGAGGRTVRLPVTALAQVWRGELATLWRVPADVPDSDDVAANAAGAAWLDKHLPAAEVDAARTPARTGALAERRARIHRFQLAQGLTPDGKAGPLTLMQLNRAAGVNEPRLRTGA